MRSTLYDELSAVRRTRRHGQVAEALEARGGTAVALVHHFARSGGPDRRTVEYGRAAAAEALERLAFDQGVAYLLEAVDTAEELNLSDGERADLLIELGNAQRLAGLPEHRATLLAAAQLAAEVGDADRLTRAALANHRGMFSSSGNQDYEQVSVLESALGMVSEQDSVDRARLMAILAVELTWSDALERRLTLADEAVAMAQRLGDDRCLLETWSTRQLSTLVPDRTGDHLRELPALLDLAERVGDEQLLILTYGRGMNTAMELAEFDLADGLLARMGQVASTTSNPVMRWIHASSEACRLTGRGSGDEVEEAATQALALGEAAGQTDAFPWFASQLFMARLLQGRAPETVDLLTQVVSDAPHFPVWRALLASALVRSDRTAEATTTVDALMADHNDPFPVDLLWLLSHWFLAHAVAGVGSPEQALVEYGRLEPYASRCPCNGTITVASSHLPLAQLAQRAGHHDNARRHFEQAADLHERLGAPLWLAETNLAWAQMLLQEDRIDTATSMLRGVHHTAMQMGAAHLARASADLLTL